MWIDTEPLHILVMPVSVLILKPMWRPQRHATKRLLEIFDCAHHHRVTHLLVELRDSLRGRKAVLRQKVRMVEINRRVGAAAGRIDVDDLNIFADRTRLKVFLPSHVDYRLVNRGGREIGLH